MTEESLAQLLEARRTSAHSWVAHCPAHKDRKPSLSIGVGRDGRVLLNCFGACPIDEVSKACRLVPAELFTEMRSTPAQQQMVAAQREKEREFGRRAGWAAGEVRRIQIAVDHLGADLARMTDDDHRGVLQAEWLHLAAAELMIAEAVLEKRVEAARRRRKADAECIN